MRLLLLIISNYIGISLCYCVLLNMNFIDNYYKTGIVSTIFKIDFKYHKIFTYKKIQVMQEGGVGAILFFA